MRKLLAACLTSLLLFSFLGCGGDKGPTHVVDDTQTPPQKKDPNAR